MRRQSHGGTPRRRTVVQRQPSDGACSADPALDGGYEDRYPLSRPLWLCTVDGIPGINSQSVWETTGTQSATYLEAQRQLVQCVQNRSLIDQAAVNAGLVTLDDDGASPVGFVSCTDRGLPQ